MPRTTTARRPSAAAAPLAAYLALAASMAIVGAYVGLAKALVAVFPVFLLAWLRFGIAALAMAGWLRRRPGERALDRSERRLLFAQSLFGSCLFTICMLYGVALTSALAAGVTMAALPAVVALLAWRWLGERIDRRVGLAVACAVAGIALVATGGAAAPAARPAPLGIALLLLAVTCEALYVVIGKRLSGRVDARRISVTINGWSLVLTTPLGLWQALGFDWAGVGLRWWGLLAVYSFAASVLTVWLWMKGLQRVPGTTAGVFTVLLPISAGAVGALVLGEPFGVLHGAAFACALAGVVLATWPATTRGIDRR